MAQEFLYQTVRAEWVIPNKPELGSYPSFQAAFDATGGRYDITYREVVVDTDPVLKAVVEHIADRIEGWFDENLGRAKQPNKHYIHGNVVRNSLSKLAKEVRDKTIKTNLENENASSETP